MCLAGCALLWELTARSGLVSPRVLPPFSKVLGVFFSLCESGVLPRELSLTLLRVARGFFLAAAALIPLGALMGLSRTVRGLFEPLIELLRPLPPPAVIPAALLFFGLGEAMKTAVIFFACAFPILLSTMEGVAATPRLFVDTARTLGAGRARILWRVVLPASLPHVFSGLRTAAPMALIVAILAEMVGGSDGIGFFILRMQRTFGIPEMYAGILALGLTGVAMNALLTLADRRCLSWHAGWRRRRH